MTEPTRRWITQILLPAVFLFGGLACMHGPAYVNYFQKQWVDYRLARDSVFGPERYEVRLKAGFVSQAGEECLVIVLSDKSDDSQSEETTRQEVILLDAWSRIVQRDLHENVGAIQSTHLSPQDGGYAVLEIVRQVPENRRVAEVARYQVTAERIDAMDSELRHRASVWDGRGWGDGRHRGHHPGRRKRWTQDERHSQWDQRHRGEWRQDDDAADAERNARDRRDDGDVDADRPEEEGREKGRRQPKGGNRQERDADLAWLAR